MGHFDYEPLEVTCPTCGKVIKEQVRWFKEDGRVCPFGCGTEFDTTEFRIAIDRANQDLEDFQRQITKLNNRTDGG